jgi:hypothetical protein
LPQKTGEPACTILEHGPYEPMSARRHYADPRAATGRSFEIDEVEFTKQATTIDMQLGVGFGIRYQVRLPADVTVTARVVYPKPLRGVPEWRNDIDLARGEHVRHFVHDFEYAWELVPGRWRFQVLVDGTPACGLTFVVK